MYTSRAPNFETGLFKLQNEEWEDLSIQEGLLMRPFRWPDDFAYQTNNFGCSSVEDLEKKNIVVFVFRMSMFLMLKDVLLD